MGILRVYLALCVVASHSGGGPAWLMHDGRQAVQVFYIISGFYMAMVLSSARYSTKRDFYLSRMMRIFPVYWITLAGTIIVSAAAGLIFHQWLLLAPYVNNPLAQNGLAGILLAAFSNLTIFGQDWVLFLSHQSGQPLRLTSEFLKDPAPLWRYLLVPQAWSIGIELTFYALAPLLSRLRSRWLLLIIAVSLSARLLTYSYLGSAHDPWTYRFFPFEISLFLFGMLGYRIYLHTASYHPGSCFRCVSRLSYFWCVMALLLMLFVHLCGVNYISGLLGAEAGLLISYPFWILGIPVLFFVFGNQRDDRRIGEMSYPIYLVHFLIIAVVSALLNYFSIRGGLGVISGIASLIVAAVFCRVVIEPLDRKRHFITQRNAKPDFE